MTNSTDASNFSPRLETGNAELRAQLAVAQEYLTKLERIAAENFATYRRQGETCDALHADLATERRQRLHVIDRVEALRECLAEDAAVIEEIREDWEVAESWARHYQEQAERKAAKVKRLKKQAAALAAEVERLTAENADLTAEFTERARAAQHLAVEVERLTAEKTILAEKLNKAMGLYHTTQEWLFEQNGKNATLAAEVERLTNDAIEARVTVASMCRELKPIFRVGFRGDNPIWACGKLRDDYQELQTEVERLRRELNETHNLAHLQAERTDKAQADLTTRAWYTDNAAYLRLDGEGPEYVTTDADGRVTHYGRGRVVKAEPLICADDMPDGDERLSVQDSEMP